MPKAKFLRSIGVNPQSGYVHKKTRDWDQRLEMLAAGVKDTHVAQQINKATSGLQTPDEVKVREEEVPAAPIAEVKDITPMIGRHADDVKPRAQMSPWQAVQEWRRKQAKEDYQTADQARLAIKLILKDSLKQVEGPDGRPAFKTSLKPHEVRQLTQAMSEVQRIQRLALGLSTENIGVDTPAPVTEGHVEKNVTPTEEPIPTFQVEMSSRGKFLRPRPRRIN